MGRPTQQPTRTEWCSKRPGGARNASTQSGGRGSRTRSLSGPSRSSGGGHPLQSFVAQLAKSNKGSRAIFQTAEEDQTSVADVVGAFPRVWWPQKLSPRVSCAHEADGHTVPAWEVEAGPPVRAVGAMSEHVQDSWIRSSDIISFFILKKCDGASVELERDKKGWTWPSIFPVSSQAHLRVSPNTRLTAPRSNSSARRQRRHVHPDSSGARIQQNGGRQADESNSKHH